MTDRQLTLHSPTLGGDQQLFVRRIAGREALSELFAYEVTLYCKSDSVDFSKLLGQELCVGLSNPRSLTSAGQGAPERYFHGYVSNFASVGAEGGYHLYRAELRPQLWRLSRSVNCRVFQNEAVPDIIAAVLKEHGITGMVTHYVREYRPWEYCVQYRESDFAFISRLMEREGIHYYFEHQKDKHVLYLGDTNPRETVRGYEEVKLRGQNSPNQIDEDVIWNWCVAKSVQPDRTTLSDYDFTKPAEPLMRTSGSEVKREHDDARDYEVYDYLETVVQQQGYSAELTEEYARIRSEELHTHYALITAETNATGLAPGFCFKLKGEVPKPAKGVDFLLIGMHVHAENDLRGSHTSVESAEVYRASFEAIEAKNPYRPPRVTFKPRIPGPQSAIVVGPQGAKDHHTDQWGRVLVKFHWYRKQQDSDTNMSCWVRVSQNSAGANWGSMFVPHIGQEVIVSFYEGDPDRPVVTGRVYNGSNKPPLELPANAYKSIIRDHYGNEIIFDGTPGSEHMAFFTPSHSSAMVLGRSKKTFTASDEETKSLNSKNYTLGDSENYTFGNSYSLSRGRTTSVAAGFNFSVFAGASASLSLSTALELKAGMTATVQMSASAAFGFARDFKVTRGEYARISKDDVILSSHEGFYASGGYDDQALITANDKELSLSFDPSGKNRGASIDGADAAAGAAAAGIASSAIAMAALSSWLYSNDTHTKQIETKNTQGHAVAQVEADLEELKGLTSGDIASAGSVAASLAGVVATFHRDIAPPKHPGPIGKIIVKKEHVQLFHGKGKETILTLHEKNGLIFGSPGGVVMSSDKDIKLTAKGKVVLTAPTVTIKGILDHPSIKAQK